MSIPVSALLIHAPLRVSHRAVRAAGSRPVLVINLWLANQIAQDAVTARSTWLGRQAAAASQRDAPRRCSSPHPRHHPDAGRRSGPGRSDLAFGRLFVERTPLALADGVQIHRGRRCAGHPAEPWRARPPGGAWPGPTLITPVRGTARRSHRHGEGARLCRRGPIAWRAQREIRQLMNRPTHRPLAHPARRGAALAGSAGADPTSTYRGRWAISWVIVLGTLRRHRQMEESER